MLITDETSAMHKQAAIDHHEAAKKHLLAADYIEKNNMANAKEMSQDALNSYQRNRTGMKFKLLHVS